METGEIAKLAWDFFYSREYENHESFPLISQDASLLFVNSSIAPFKPILLNGETIKKTFIIQNCFRNHYRDSSLFNFHMLGLLGPISDMERIMDDFLEFITQCVGINKEKLHVVLDSDDRLLRQYCLKRFRSKSIHHSKGDPKFSTKWRFGEGDTLTGYGLTVVVESIDSRKCTSTCDVFCTNCNCYFPLGNLIIVTANILKKTYIEVGFGLEGLAASRYNNDYYEVSPYPELINLFKDLGFSVIEAAFLARHFVGGATLVSEHIVISNKKGGYVLKRITRSILEMIFDKYRDIQSTRTAIDRIVLPVPMILIGGYTEFRDILGNEAEKYARTIEKGIQGLEKYINSLNTIDKKEQVVSYLKATFGLPEFLINQYIMKSS